MSKLRIPKMMKHYNAETFGESFDKHPVLEQARAVESAFAAQGLEVDLVGMLTPDAGSEPAKSGLYLTPNLSESLEETLDNIGWLSTNREIAETFGDASASAELTNLVVRNDLEVGEVVEMLANAEYGEDDDTDMLTKVLHVVELVGAATDPRPAQVAAYDILRKSLGWKAEKCLAATDDFHKALASMDDMGVDLGTNKASPWDCGDAEGFQLKTMQRVTSQNLHNEEHEVPHLSYSWTESGISVATMDERAGSDAQAAEMKERAGTRSGTIMKKSEKVGETGDYKHPARVVAWE